MKPIEKILKVLEIKNLTPTKAERIIGVSQGVLTKAIERGGSVHDSTLEKFIRSFHVEQKWWDTGKGEIFQENPTSVSEPEIKQFQKTDSRKTIPFYDIPAVGGNALLADQTPVSDPTDMVEPGTFFRSATGALRVYGHSMFPKYPAGCIIAYKPTMKEIIIWGEDYVLELEDRRIVKRLEKSEEKDWVKAVSYNINKDNKYIYDPIDIPKEKIKRLFMVLGKIELEVSI